MHARGTCLIVHSVLCTLANRSITEQSCYSMDPAVYCRLMEKLIDIMEDDEDVQNVWHNWE